MKAKAGAILLTAMVVAVGAQADTFGTGANQFSIDFVAIGYTGNPANVDGYGVVDHDYRIGTHEVTLDQFAKARAADSRIGDGDEGYWNDGIRTVGADGPASLVSAYEAMKFANWLTTGDAYTGTYQFDGSGTLVGVDRDAAVSTYGIVYVLPSEDEWYKAAYFNLAASSYTLFANGSDIAESVTHGTANGWNYHKSGYLNDPPNYTWETGFGAEEQNGTFDMMGNIWEWNESAWDGNLNGMGENRVVRGGGFDLSVNYLHYWNRWNGSPSSKGNYIGFRVAAISDIPFISISVLGSGSINIPDGAYYELGTNLVLEATADAGWLFMGWSGSIEGDHTTAVTNLLVNGPISITATFSDDADGDGILNTNETVFGTNPRNSDSDSDGLDDYQELYTYSTDPLIRDMDSDGLSDGEEILIYYTDPEVVDTDMDGFDDFFEVSTGFDPASDASVPELHSNIRTAIEFEFYALTGMSYRIEATDALSNTWSAIEAVITNEGPVVKRFYSIGNQSNRYFRARRN